MWCLYICTYVTHTQTIPHRRTPQHIVHEGAVQSWKVRFQKKRSGESNAAQTGQLSSPCS